jgi:hypothetical protein
VGRLLGDASKYIGELSCQACGPMGVRQYYLADIFTGNRPGRRRWQPYQFMSPPSGEVESKILRGGKDNGNFIGIICAPVTVGRQFGKGVTRRRLSDIVRRVGVSQLTKDLDRARFAATTLGYLTRKEQHRSILAPPYRGCAPISSHLFNVEVTGVVVTATLSHCPGGLWSVKERWIGTGSSFAGSRYRVKRFTRRAVAFSEERRSCQPCGI